MAQSLFNICIAFIVFTVTSTSMVSSGSWHQKNPHRKMHWGTRTQAILEKYLYCLLQFLESWKPNMNQVIPCFIIMWKSSGSFFIIGLIFNLSLGFSMTDLGRFTLLLLKVTLTSFQSSFKVSQI